MRAATIWLERYHNAWYREAGRKVDPCGVSKEDETEFIKARRDIQTLHAKWRLGNCWT